ncbi:12836_t:CDS:2 [Ambispora gerdemannii]|uniref:3-hydroxyisobutyrate dehydrogenase n=1 Tax=Ambispora gerdemannii TaxID=144530 RepID=A0A9N9FUS7_9GLOM|nr:12836_t:CDS:2 [Ambispora gerdemannii]
MLLHRKDVLLLQQRYEFCVCVKVECDESDEYNHFILKYSRNNAIGFIGLGQMGFKMANNLYRKSGAPFVLYDLNAPVIDKFIELQQTSSLAEIRIAKTPKEVAQAASVVITMLPNSPHVEEVYLGEEGLVHAVDKDNLLIDSSTIDQSVAKSVAEAIIAKGARAIDAPVSGGIVGAEAATLTFMVGAPTTEDFDRAQPILSQMGKNIIHCGKSGSGQTAKICNNMLLAISMIGVSETMNLGRKLGMDPKLLANILNSSTGRCWSSDTYNPVPGILPNVPSSNDYKGGFATKLMAKDLRLAVNAANDTQSTILLGTVAQQLYNQLSETPGFKDKDFSSIYQWLNLNKDD